MMMKEMTPSTTGEQIKNIDILHSFCMDSLE